jgi:hypothetical protein
LCLRPVYQNNKDTVKYVNTAKKSQINGLLKLGHIAIWLGKGKNQYATQILPI